MGDMWLRDQREKWRVALTKPTKPRAKVRKPRRPADWRYRPTGPIAASIDGACIFVDGPLYPSEARRLAAWLLKAADYLEAKEKGGG